MTRIKNDAYYTPLPLYRWLSDRLQLTNQAIFDPCCGNSHATYKEFITVISRNSIVENDIDQSVDSYYHFDASTPWIDRIPDFYQLPIDWVITNPPYKRGMSEAIVKQSLLHAKTGVAMLLRLSWLEPVRNRKELLTCYGDRKTLKAVYPVSPRPKFDPERKGNDSVTVAWFIWGNESVVLPPFDFCVRWQHDQEIKSDLPNIKTKECFRCEGSGNLYSAFENDWYMCPECFGKG